MRVSFDPQLKIGQSDIAKIKFNPKSRDDIPQVLKGLQYLYLNKRLRESVFKILEKNISPKADKRKGRPGLCLWNILVMGVLRLDLNWDYDQLHEQVNNHRRIRQMLGHSEIFDDYEYHPQTILDNVRLLTPEVLDQINQEIVKSGHELVKKKGNEVLHGRCDSFVVKTNVHYPTDINLLYDALRKVIDYSVKISEIVGSSDWRQHVYNKKHVKRQMRIVQKKKRSRGKDLEKKEIAVKQAHQEYITICQSYLDKAQESISNLEKEGSLSLGVVVLKLSLDEFMNHALRQIEQIKQRVMEGKKIPHDEKVFSLFQPHTEWIVKGKAGISQELGLRVCVLEDSNQFLLHHQVMEKQTDDQVAVSMVKEVQERFSDFKFCSFDKGFHSQSNQEELKSLLEVAALPRKGKLSKASKEIESSKAFRETKQKHSAVESAINALEVHGLDQCHDHGIEGFKRYVALAILARNIHRIGTILIKKEIEREERKKRKQLRKIPEKEVA